MSQDPVDVLNRELSNSKGLPFAPMEKAIIEVYGANSKFAEFMEHFRSFQGKFKQFEEDYDVEKIGSEPEKFEPEVEDIVGDAIKAAEVLVDVFRLAESRNDEKEQEFWEIIFRESLDTLSREFIRIDKMIGNLAPTHRIYSKIENKFSNNEKIQFAVKTAKKERGK